MKKLIVMLAVLASQVSFADTQTGVAHVFVKDSQGLIMVRGDAAVALYEAMSDVEAKPLEGKFSGYAKTGENYACTRIDLKNIWRTSCYFKLSKVENGSVGEITQK